MSILSWIVVGLIAGWLAEQFSGRDHGLLKNLVVGVIGALIGGVLFTSLLGFTYDRGINLPTIFTATIGSILLLYIRDWSRGRDRLRDHRS